MSREKLEALDRLQDIDLQIEELTKKADSFPARLAALAAEADKARAAADLERGRLADNERARRQAESTLDEEKDKVKKWESRLPALKHQREFTALEREINAAKKSNEDAAALLVTLKADAGPLRAALSQRDAELAAKEAALARERGDLQQNEAALREQAAALQAGREKARAAVDPKVYATYELVRRRRGGRVLVTISRDACTGCHRRLLPRVVNSVLNGHVETCPACSRLLLAPPPPPEAQV